MAAVLLVAGCGGGEVPEKKAAAKPKVAGGAQEFADRFEQLTGMRLQAADDSFGTRLDEPDADGLGYRVSGFSYTWTSDDSARGVLLRGSAGPGDTRWDKLGDGWSVAKAYGPRLVVSWVGADSRAPSPEWERIDRLSEAAFTGDESVLRPEERPCRGEPRDGDVCSVDGIPVTVVGGRDELVTPAVAASVTGMSTSRTIDASGSALRASGTWVVVAYRVQNAGSKPIRYLKTALRIGGETFQEDAGASVYLPRSRTMPLPPDEEIETEVAFDVPAAVAERAARVGALILPAERDELGDPNIAFAQGWVRLSTVPSSLPDIAPPAAPDQPPPPQGPPAIPVERGDGPPSGGSARRLYTANSFFPVPPSFVPGGVRAGTRAGSCVVPPVRDSVRARLLATVRHDTPRGKGRVTGLPDRMILLADCGGAGRWAIVAWVGRRGEGGPVIFVDEFQWRGGAWHGSPKGRWPGCGIPEAAAAAWQIDISHCADRPQAPGEVS